MDRDDDIRWLMKHSMLAQGEEIRARDSGRGTLWQRPYAETQPPNSSAATPFTRSTYWA